MLPKGLLGSIPHLFLLIQHTLLSTYVPGIEFSAEGTNAPSSWFNGNALGPEAPSGRPALRQGSKCLLPGLKAEESGG